MLLGKMGPKVPLVLLLVVSVYGNTLRKVVYHEGITVDDRWSSLEGIPPREEWFRVRGDSRSHPRAKAVRLSEEDIVTLSSSSSGSRVVGNVVASPRRISEIIPEMNEGQPDAVQVHVRNYGSVGFQKNGRVSAIAESRKHIANGVSRLPSGAQEKNWYQRVRHEGGHRNRTVTEVTEGVNDDDNRMQNEPTEPEIEEDSQLERESVNSDEKLYEDENGQLSQEIQSKPVKALRTEGFVRTSNQLNPPPHDQVAKMARYVVHNSEWASLATISTISSVRGFPFVNSFSLSDGPVNNSSGIPYFYVIHVTPLDMSVTDLKRDSRASLTVSLAQSDYCKEKQYDPEDPRCAKVILTGTFAKVDNPREVQFAQNAVFSRHPEMEQWPKDHDWFFAKLDIENIIVLDYFGGAKNVALDDYYNQTL